MKKRWGREGEESGQRKGRRREGREKRKEWRGNRIKVEEKGRR